jgi:hypothetical protein
MESRKARGRRHCATPELAVTIAADKGVAETHPMTMVFPAIPTMINTCGKSETNPHMTHGK